jgi:hypothetical protein
MALQNKNPSSLRGFCFGKYRDENAAGSASATSINKTEIEKREAAQVATPQSQMALQKLSSK